MERQRRPRPPYVFLLAAPLVSLCPGGGFILKAAEASPSASPGHSLHGEAFDDGPRRRGPLLEGMGEVDFPVTTVSEEARRYFQQGVAQLHTFYYFEAERSFRQAAALDPACAMAYWGMAMANWNNGKRARAFVARASSASSPTTTDRERKYLQALSAYFEEGKKDEERVESYLKGLEKLVLAYPEDSEAKAFLAWGLISFGRVQSRVAVDSLLEEVLRRSPRHPGAHHYRIHLWDHDDPEVALRSALAYGRAAPGIAHAWHMPGHIFNGLGRWSEAAWQQEASLRVDHAHMLRHSVLPFEIHNYAHNHHYLVANLAHLGRVEDAIRFSRDLIATPRDPQKNSRDNGGSPQRLGRVSLMRVYVRYERWADLLLDPALDWSDVPQEEAWRAYSRGLAWLGLGDRERCRQEAARLDEVAAAAAKKKAGETDLMEAARLELRGRLSLVEGLAEGKVLEAFDLLQRGAKLQNERFRNDLAGYPRPMLEVLGQAHLQARDWGLAEACFREALEKRRDMLPSLAGLVEACYGGERYVEAAEACGRYLTCRSRADRGLFVERRLEPIQAALAARGLSPRPGLAGEPRPASGDGVLTSVPPAEAEAAPLSDLESLGPALWTASAGPEVSFEDQDQKELRLQDLRGKNVLLVFYLGADCGPCMEQVAGIGKERAAWESLDTRVVLASEDPPARNREVLAGPGKDSLPFPLYTDRGRKAARLYGAHDTFEDLALHGVFILDREGRLRWGRVGAAPFTDLAFLKTEIERLNRLARPAPRYGRL